MSNLFVRIQKSEYERASLLSKLFFGWVTNAYITLFDKDISEDDLYEISETDGSENVTDRLTKAWNHELKGSGQPNLTRACRKVFWKQYMCYGFLLLFENLLQLGQCVFIWKILFYSKHDNYDQNKLLLWSGFFILDIWLCVLVRNIYFFLTLKAGLQLKIGFSGLIYEKILRLNQEAVAKTSVGKIINVLSNDVQRIEMCLPFLHYVWIGPLISVLAMILLYLLSKEGGLVAMVVMLVIIPFQVVLGRIYAVLRKKVIKITDERIKLISEMLNGIKTIKMYCWEPIFINLIAKVRNKEVMCTLWQLFILSNQAPLYIVEAKVVIYIMIIVNIYLRYNIGVEIVFAALGIFNYLRLTYTRHLQHCLISASDLFSCIHRTNEILILPELEDKSKITNIPLNRTEHNESLPLVEMENVTVRFLNDENGPNVLENVSFRLEGPQLCAIVGETGSGKSSLLLALLNEMSIMSGKITIRGSTSYSSQQPFLVRGSVLKNVLFYNRLNADYLRKSLTYSLLCMDITEMPKRLQTRVGDRGIQLSGGQKSRLSLARVLYSNPDIVLLDDPLASLDAAVSQCIFNQCIYKYLDDKLVLFVTNKLDVLKECSKIIFVSNGQIQLFEGYNQLMESEIIELTKLFDQLKGDSFNVMSQKRLDTIIDDSEMVSIMTKKENSMEHIQMHMVGPSSQTTGMHMAGSDTATNTDDNRFHFDVSLKDVQSEKDATENNFVGGIKWRVYKQVFWPNYKFFFLFLLIIVLLAVSMVLHVLCDLTLASWTNRNDNLNVTVKYIDDEDTDYLVFLTYLTVAMVLLIYGTVVLFFVMQKMISRRLHNRMLESVINSPMSFFNINPIGRTINRFSKDINIIDETIPYVLIDAILILSMIAASLFIAGFKNNISILAIILMIFLLLIMRHPYVQISRSIKRIRATTYSPIFSHVMSTLQGLQTIRALKKESYFIEDFHMKQDRNTKASFFFIATTRWFAMRLDEICFVFISIVTISCSLMVRYSMIFPSSFGLVLVSIVSLIGMVQWAIRQTTEFQHNMVSAERVLEYMDLPWEPKKHISTDDSRGNWPSEGAIKFNHVSLTYPKSTLPILKNVNFSVKPGEKIGIVGRTGAGKSSLIALLFRLEELDSLKHASFDIQEPNSPIGYTESNFISKNDSNSTKKIGGIFIDDVNIKNVGLHKLRSSIGSIPQDPFTIIGSIRENLDPLSEFSEQELWDALKSVGLTEAVRQLPNGLENQIVEGGTNLSIGQRQLICLARALLRKTKIVVIDEATASVDDQTQEIIQKTIHTCFKDRTVLTVAHRLRTIMDSDRIFVMSNGRLIESGHPHELLNSKVPTEFCNLVEQSSAREAQHLKSIARESYRSSIHSKN